jgi:hypothetical protein
VIIRKNSYANGSDAGADLQAVLMSIYRTLKQRGHNPLETIVSAVRTYLKTGKLPPLPVRITENDTEQENRAGFEQEGGATWTGGHVRAGAARTGGAARHAGRSAE